MGRAPALCAASAQVKSRATPTRRNNVDAAYRLAREMPLTCFRPTPRRALAALAATAVLAGCFEASAAADRLTSTGLSSGVVRRTFDLRVRPQDDLYAHVNGGWLKTAKFAPDKAYIGASQELADTIQLQLRTLVEEASRARPDAEAAKLGDLFASFMDEPAIERAGLRPLATELAAIDAVADRAQLTALWARLGRIGVDMPLAGYVGQDDRDATRYVPFLVQTGLGLPDRDYYLDLRDAKFQAARLAYARYLARLLTLAAQAEGGSAAGAEHAARNVLALETAIARVQWSKVENRDPVKAHNPVDRSGLAALAPAFGWPGFLDAAGFGAVATPLVVRQPSYVRALGGLLGSVPLATWKAHARCRLLAEFAPYLGKGFVDARFAFGGTVLSGRQSNTPRWQRGVTLVDVSMGDALGKLYVARHFPAESQQRIEALVSNLLGAYRESISGLDWMGPDTQARALEKLAQLTTKIGAPKHPVDYAALAIDANDLLGNVLRARRFEVARQVAKLGQLIDRDEWGMTAQTLNAYYNASLNEIVFPAAHLQPPFFDPRADDAANYGAIGMVIGHEISHGFDDEGSQYDGAGNLRDWWAPADRERFKARTSRLVAQYNGFEPVRGYRVNGALTLGENIADNAGLSIAYKAYQRSLGGQPAPVIDGFSGDERFFFGFAQSWRSKARTPALLAQIKADPHTPDDFRVRGALRNLPAFYGSFGVKPGDRMYLPPAERVSTW